MSDLLRILLLSALVLIVVLRASAPAPHGCLAIGGALLLGCLK